MASKNQVTLTFAGDTEKLEDAFDRVGGAADSMADEVEDSTRSFDTLGGGIDTLGDKGGDLESGFRGITDSMSGFAQIAEGDVMGGVTDLAGGVEALAMGFSGVLVPALQKTVTWLGNTKVGMMAQAAWSGIVAGATKVWTGVQAALNFVMAMNPIVLVIIAIVALVAIIVIAYQKSETFRKIVQAAFKFVVLAAKALWEGVKMYFNFWKGIIDKVMGWVGDIPSRIGRAFRGLGNAISAPFRAGFDAVRRFWNNTIGGKGFDIPSWVPFVGGKSFRFPTFHRGGIVPGAPGQEVMAVLQAGERVTPAGQSTGRSLGPEDLTMPGGSGLERMFLAWLQDAMRRNNLRLVAAA